MSAKRRMSAALATAALLILAWAVPATAHVVIDPGTAVKGTETELAFRVPNEMDDADTTQIDVKFPTDHPIASVAVKPKAGWTYQVKTEKLAKPITTDDGQVTDIVSQITWTGGKIAPGEYDDFQVSAGPLPTDTDQITFPTLQTYSNGQVVSWIETQQAGGPEPEHPAPILHLVDNAAEVATGTNTDHGATATTNAAGTTTKATVSAGSATTSQVHSARTIAVIGIVIGVLGLLAAASAIALATRKHAPAPDDAGS